MKVKYYNNYFVEKRTKVMELITNFTYEMENEKEAIEDEENEDNKRNMEQNVKELQKAIELLQSAYHALNGVHPNQYNQVNQ